MGFIKNIQKIIFGRVTKQGGTPLPNDFVDWKQVDNMQEIIKGPILPESMDHFTFVPDNIVEDDKQFPTGHLICKRCGQRVETGIINVSYHWSKCYPEEYTAAMKWACEMTEVEKITRRLQDDREKWSDYPKMMRNKV